VIEVRVVSGGSCALIKGSRACGNLKRKKVITCRTEENFSRKRPDQCSRPEAF
jgi:hypothetical protein